MIKALSKGRDGFINVCKPPGITSFMAVKKLKRLEKGLKIGHLGTLDPMAEGVLPIALGGATRLISYIPDRSKKYIAEAVLGAVSNTQDIWGQVEWQGPVKFDMEALASILNQYRGSISQVPPMFSAVHHQGQRLYQLARQGLEVERPARSAVLYDLRLLSCQPQPPEGHTVMKLEVHCSEGTYIRTLCHDIGQQLGCGAVMSRLERTAWGVFTIEQSVSLQALADRQIELDEVLLSPETPLQNLPLISVEQPELLDRLYNGNTLEYHGQPEAGCFRIQDQLHQRLAALAKIRRIADHDYLQPVVVLKP